MNISNIENRILVSVCCILHGRCVKVTNIIKNSLNLCKIKHSVSAILWANIYFSCIWYFHEKSKNLVTLVKMTWRCRWHKFWSYLIFGCDIFFNFWSQFTSEIMWSKCGLFLVIFTIFIGKNLSASQDKRGILNSIQHLVL